MRIGIEYSAAINQSAGIGRLVRNQVNALAGIDRENEFVLLHARPNPSRELSFPKAPNFSHRQIPITERWLTIGWHRAQLPLPADWFTGLVDLFHSPDFVLPPLRHALGILTVHDLAFLLRPECADARLSNYLETVVPRSVRRADFVIADSENTRNDVVVLLGVRPERVEVVPGGVDSHFAPVDDPAQIQAARERLGVGDSPFILSVGVLEPRKNLVTLMEAFAAARSRGKLREHKLVLAGGRGWLVEGILSHHDISPVRDNILMPGFVADDLLPAAYSSADALAFPSLYEGFGLPVLEAMACGTPVVTSNASCIPEVAEGASIMVDPLDTEALSRALVRVVEDVDLQADLRHKGFERAAQYTWTAAATRLLEVYRRVGASGGLRAED